MASIMVFSSALTAETAVGVAWQGKSVMTSHVLKGLEASLANVQDIKLEIKKELPDAAALTAAVTEFEKNKKGLIIFRSNAAGLIKSRDLLLPTFVGAVNNPIELGIATSLDKPKKNLTGVTYYIPASVKLDTFKRVYPAMKEFILLVEEGHPSSKIDADETLADAAKLGLSGKSIFCKTLDEATAAIVASSPSTSLVLGSQALLMNNAGKIIEAAGNRPVFSYSEVPIKAGALLGVVADDEKLGKMLGLMVAEVLVNGKNIDSLAFQTDPEPMLYINAKTAERLKIQIPFDILSVAKIVE